MEQAILDKVNTYTIDPNHSTIHFWVRHLMVSKVHGELHGVTGTIAYAPQKPEEAQIEVTIDVHSLSTHNDQRDGHLKSPDFFDVEQFPAITFKATGIKKKAETDFEIVGDLTLHGVTKPVTFEAEVTPEAKSPFGGYLVGITAKGVLNREDFGMVYN